MKKPVALREVISALERSQGWGAGLRHQRPLRFWDEAVGEEVARVARPEGMRGKALWVSVVSSIWLHELMLREEKIRERLNTLLGEEAVGRIFFRVDPAVDSPRGRPE